MKMPDYFKVLVRPISQKVSFEPIYGDLTEVVRCKDCKYYKNEDESAGLGWCELNSHICSTGEWTVWYEEDFCSLGERKEE